MSSPSSATDTGAATGTSGTAGATTGSATGTTGSASGKTYRLIANSAALTEHVGKKLELTGVLDDEKAASSSPASGEESGPALRVQSGKIVAASCTP
ncbi:MAG TPA: hypothetical protein VKD69_16270 [Vicinamibacterales bacterium]|nr:hypothetical protein [Vicinamibacterales bacterium]